MEVVPADFRPTVQNRSTDGTGDEQPADIGDFGDFLGATDTPPTPPGRLHAHQALELELQQCLAHRDAADVELSSDLVLDEPRTSAQIATQDGIPQESEHQQCTISTRYR